MALKKIKVKDYYAIRRGKKRLEKIPEEKRKEIGRKGAKAKWSKKSCDGTNMKNIKDDRLSHLKDDRLLQLILNPPFEKTPHRELIEEGEYNGVPYIIGFYYNHAVAYIFVNKWRCIVEPDEIERQPHGGFTYDGYTLGFVDYKGWFIGWDYAHAGDFQKFRDTEIEGRVWTLNDVRLECHEVIDSLIKAVERSKNALHR